jgi:hypothetical protein
MFVAKVKETTGEEDWKVDDNNDLKDMESCRRDLSYEAERCDDLHQILGSANSGKSHFSKGMASNSAEEADISSKLSKREIAATRASIIPLKIFIVRAMTSNTLEQSDTELSSLSLGSDATDSIESSSVELDDDSSDENENSNLCHVEIPTSHV